MAFGRWLLRLPSSNVHLVGTGPSSTLMLTPAPVNTGVNEGGGRVVHRQRGQLYSTLFFSPALDPQVCARAARVAHPHCCGSLPCRTQAHTPESSVDAAPPLPPLLLHHLSLSPPPRPPRSQGCGSISTSRACSIGSACPRWKFDTPPNGLDQVSRSSHTLVQRQPWHTAVRGVSPFAPCQGLHFAPCQGLQMGDRPFVICSSFNTAVNTRNRGLVTYLQAG